MRALKAAVPMRSNRPTPPTPEPRPVTPGLLEAKAARRESTDHLVAAIERDHVVRHVAERVQEHARQNHFFELLAPTFTKRSPR